MDWRPGECGESSCQRSLGIAARTTRTYTCTTNSPVAILHVKVKVVKATASGR